MTRSVAEADEAAFEPADGGGGREAYAAWRWPMPRERRWLVVTRLVSNQPMVVAGARRLLRDGGRCRRRGIC